MLENCKTIEMSVNLMTVVKIHCKIAHWSGSKVSRKKKFKQWDQFYHQTDTSGDSKPLKTKYLDRVLFFNSRFSKFQ